MYIKKIVTALLFYVCHAAILSVGYIALSWVLPTTLRIDGGFAVILFVAGWLLYIVIAGLYLAWLKPPKSYVILLLNAIAFTLCILNQNDMMYWLADITNVDGNYLSEIPDHEDAFGATLLPVTLVAYILFLQSLIIHYMPHIERLILNRKKS